MRRLIAYITTAIAMLLAIGVAATPVITKFNTGREYTNGRNYREIVFNVKGEESNSKYDERANIVAEEMKERLNNYNVEDYSIKVQGDDTVTVSMNMSKKEFNYAAKYLCFSGESFALVTEKSVRKDNEIFNIDDVYIDYQGDQKVPVIILPVTEKGKEDIKALINEFGEESSSDSSKLNKKTRATELKADDEHNHEGEEGEETEKHNYMYLWANLDDERDETYASLNVDPIARDKVLMAFDVASCWNPDSDEEETELFYVCATATEDSPTTLDVSGLKDDNARANYLVNMLKAKKYAFDVECPTAQVLENPDSDNFSVDYFENARVIKASAEKLLAFDTNLNINVKSKTFIATMIAIVIISLLLVVYYRLSALAMISTTLATVFITLASFTKMQVLFNLPAIIGLVILSAGVLFGQIFYVNHLKEEIYKGRSIKKANQEASKKSNLVTVDSAVIMAFSGLMMYSIGGTALKPLGVALFFGAVFTLLMNLLVFKLLMYLLTNSTNVQNKYNLFNIDGDKVPNLMSTNEKVVYESPYEKVDFTKRKTLIGSLFGVLTVAAAAAIIVFGVTSSTKSPLNIENAVKDINVAYVTIDVTNNDDPLVKDKETFINVVLEGTGLEKDEDITSKIDFQDVSVYEYDDEHPTTTTTYFISVNDIEIPDDSDQLTVATRMETNLDDKGLTDHDVSIKTSKELVYTPSQGFVALATGISIIGAALYCGFRFRPSRGVAMFVTTAATTTIAYGVMAGLHFVGTTALTSVAMPLVAVTMMIASLFYFSEEKVMFKENRVGSDFAARKENMIKALGKSASPMFIFMLVNIYIAINFFAFGVDNITLLFASALIGEVVAVIALVTLVGPFAELIAKGLSKIHLPSFKFLKKDDKNKNQHVKKSSEPEETIFIGIND